MADLTFTYGLMGSGKSVAAINTIISLQEGGAHVCAITCQSRALNAITDRSGRSVPALTIDSMGDLPELSGEALVVDEAQFLVPTQVEEFAEIAECGIDVHCYGLLTDFRREFFPGALELLRLATHTESLTPPVCDRACGRPASVNARIVNGLVQRSGPQVLVGDVGAAYAVLCSGCFDG